MSNLRMKTSQLAMRAPHIVPSGRGCGAEVAGIDLAAIDAATGDALKQTLQEHLMVFVRGQPISDTQLIALGKSPGRLEPPSMSITGMPYIEDYPDILMISNLAESGQPAAGQPRVGEAIWHTDCRTARPYTYPILYALEVPSVGGNTYSANQ